MTAIQIETLGSLADADAIAANDAAHLLFIGPADLSIALEAPGQFHTEILWEAIGKVAAACQRHGKAREWSSRLFRDRAMELGCRMPTMDEVGVMRRDRVVPERLRQPVPQVAQSSAAVELVNGFTACLLRIPRLIHG
jgi:2-keto-3-deoxy-L-rhamnonate aldolase RhmA